MLELLVCISASFASFLVICWSSCTTVINFSPHRWLLLSCNLLWILLREAFPNYVSYRCLNRWIRCVLFYTLHWSTIRLKSTDVPRVFLGAAYIVLNPEYRKPTHRGARTKVFCALGLSAVIPIIHGLFDHGFTTFYVEMGFKWLVASGALYLSGAWL